MNVMTPTRSDAVTLGEKGLNVPLSRGDAYFNYYWLRDNDPTSFNADTRERSFDIFHLDTAPVARDDAFIERVIESTSAGGTCINQSVVHFLHTHLPFGGVNNSGLGNSHGHYGFRAFSHERAVLRERFSLAFLFLPPYTRFTRWVIRLAVKYMN